MISVLPKPRSGNPTLPEKYRKRLEEVLGPGKESMEYLSVEQAGHSRADPESPAPAANEPTAPDVAVESTAQAPTLADDAARSERKVRAVGGVELGLAARQIADTLVETFGQAVREVHLQVAATDTRVEAAADTVIQLSGDLRQATSEFSTLSARVDWLALEQAQQGSKLSEIDGRLSEEAQGSRQTQELLEKLGASQEATTQQVQTCTDRLSAIEARILQLCERLDNLGSRYEKADQLHQSAAERLASHEEMIFMLRTETQQPIGMLERVLGSLRTLDLRKETRFPVDEEVTVTIDSESGVAMSGRIVDASENGVRVLLDTTLPPTCKVHIESAHASLAGTVAYSIPKGDKHAAGIRLSQPLHGRGKSAGQGS